MSWLRTQARQTSASGSDEGREQWRLPVESMRELEMKAAGAIGVEEGELFIRVIKQYAKAFQEEVQR